MRTAGHGGCSLAALPRSVTEIDGVVPAHSRTYRNILSTVGVLCADRMPLFINFSSDACFQQGSRRRSESPYKTDIAERDYKTDIIEGRATGARPGWRIVLYAKTDGRWGVCRQSGQPFTYIETDGRWKASVHLGIQYAALLVDPTYNPQNKLNRCRLSATAWWRWQLLTGRRSAGTPSPKILNFSGYEWTTSTGPIFHAGSRNFFDPANVWTDERGALHLRHFGKSGKSGLRRS